MQRLIAFIAVAAAAVLGAGCSKDLKVAAVDSAKADSVARARQDSFNRAQPGYVVDSIFTPEENLRRFRAAIGGDSATAFTGGSATRHELVRRFVVALAQNDSETLRAMVVHPREFADLYYPGSPYARPPYQQPAAFAWRFIQDPSNAGFTKLLRRVAGTRISYVDDVCDPKLLREGRTTRYAGCLVKIRQPDGAEATKRYFGSIVEHGGQFKFLSYTNDF